MQDDFSAKYKLSNEQLENFAEEFRARNNLDDADKVDILKCLDVGWVWTLKGNKKITYVEVEDAILGSRDAEATSDETSALIRVKSSVGQAVRKFLRSGIDSTKARRGVFTLAHELGHVTLCHEFASRGRKSAGSSTETEKVVQAFESSERQANVWASAILMGRSRLRKTDTAESVSFRFGVSLEAAKIRLDQVFKRKSPVVLNGFKELMDRLGSPRNKNEKPVEKVPTPTFDELKEGQRLEKFGSCPECGENSLCHDHGNNYSCHNAACRAKNISLPEGDL